jgi:hypothetical protein
MTFCKYLAQIFSWKINRLAVHYMFIRGAGGPYSERSDTNLCLQNFFFKIQFLCNIITKTPKFDKRSRDCVCFKINIVLAFLSHLMRIINSARLIKLFCIFQRIKILQHVIVGTHYTPFCFYGLLSRSKYFLHLSIYNNSVCVFPDRWYSVRIKLHRIQNFAYWTNTKQIPLYYS